MALALTATVSTNCPFCLRSRLRKACGSAGSPASRESMYRSHSRSCSSGERWAWSAQAAARSACEDWVRVAEPWGSVAAVPLVEPFRPAPLRATMLRSFFSIGGLLTFGGEGVKERGMLHSGANERGLLRLGHGSTPVGRYGLLV